MINKSLLKTVLIALSICQIIALLIWLLFDENYFIIMLIAPIIGLIFGYKGAKNKN